MTAVDIALASWNDTPTRAAITDFVARVTEPDSPHFVLPEGRVAVFDNDGTLWTEKPLPIQADFLLRRVGEMGAADPSLNESTAVEGRRRKGPRLAQRSHYQALQR